MCLDLDVVSESCVRTVAGTSRVGGDLGVGVGTGTVSGDCVLCVGVESDRPSVCFGDTDRGVVAGVVFMSPPDSELSVICGEPI